MTIKGLGWNPDDLDVRDYIFTTRGVIKSYSELPTFINLRPMCPPVYDQGDLGSCTAQSTSGMCQFVLGKQRARDLLPSPLFLYYATRDIEGTTSLDAGATLRNTLKAINVYGVCKEEEWPYDVSNFMSRPPSLAYTNAELHQAIKYERVPQNLNSLRTLLYSGFPFVFGFSVFESFYEVGESGTARLPSASEQLLGGHAVMAVGYDDEAQQFLIRNSWGSEWGIGGYFYMPYSFVTDGRLSRDFWTITEMEVEPDVVVSIRNVSA